MTPHYPSLKRWAPQIHDYSGQTIDLYEGAVLLVDAAHIRAGDHLLLGRRRSPVRYRVRHVEYHGGRPAYWRVQLERPLPSPVPAAATTAGAPSRL